MTYVVYAAIALFIGIGMLALIAPAIMASLVGNDALSRDAANEVRAVYGGLNLGVSVALIATLGAPASAGVQFAVGLMLLGMMGGRVLSALIDGSPSSRMWGYAVLEACFGVPLVWMS
jgi:hypothetical protein